MLKNEHDSRKIDNILNKLSSKSIQLFNNYSNSASEQYTDRER